MSRVLCSGRLFQKVAAETGKPHLPTVERLNSTCYCKLVGGRRPESLPRWHVSDTGEAWRQIRWCTSVHSSVGR